MKRYSSDMYARPGFSVAVHSDPDIPLVVEVLSVGDAAFQEKCFAKMRDFQDQGVTIVLVSHGLDMDRKFCHRALLLDGGRVVAEGDPEETIGRCLERVTPQVETASSGECTGVGW